MSEKETMTTIESTFERFANILTEQSQRTDQKLESLAEANKEVSKAVKELTISHIESKKDREYDSQRMERLEENQKALGTQVKEVSETVLLIHEREVIRKEGRNRVIAWVSSVSGGVVTVSILIWWGLKSVG